MTQIRSALKPDLFAHEAWKRKIGELGDPLQIISEHIDFAHLAGLIEGLFPRADASRGGRPPYPTEVMVRVLILKRLYNLSDEQVQYQLLDRMSFRRFCQLQESAAIPDRNTVWQFQQRIGEDGATALFQGVDMQIEQHGYKLSTSVDARHKFIRKVHTGTASEHDSTHFEQVLDMGNTGSGVFADRGYPGKQRSELLGTLGLKDNIQRKGQRGKPLSDCQKGRNRRIASTRARAEHLYAQIRHMGGKLIRTIGQARATAAMTLMAACYNLKRLARFLHDGVDPFYKKKRRTRGRMRPEAANV